MSPSDFCDVLLGERPEEFASLAERVDGAAEKVYGFLCTTAFMFDIGMLDEEIANNEILLVLGAVSSVLTKSEFARFVAKLKEKMQPRG